MKVLVVGGTGFIGRFLLAQLKEPVVVGRSLERCHRMTPGIEARIWDPGQALDPELFTGADAVVNLAGASIFKGRWTRARKEILWASRVATTRRLVTALGQMARPPAVLVSGSAIGYYGDGGEQRLEESMPPGDDFLARLCLAWEQEALKARDLGIRVVLLRTGIVLGAGGGALARMVTPFRLGLGGRLGHGRQYMSWIHIEDLAGIILHALESRTLQGPVNGVAPEPVTNAVFTQTLATVLHRPAVFPVPATLLRLALGEFASVLLASQRAVPAAALAAGYQFRYPGLSAALSALF